MKPLTRSQKNAALAQYHGEPLFLTKDYAFGRFFVFPRGSVQDVLDWWNVGPRVRTTYIDRSRIMVPTFRSDPDPYPDVSIPLAGPWKPAAIETNSGLPVWRPEEVGRRVRWFLTVGDNRRVDAQLLRIGLPAKVANRFDEMEWYVPDNGAPEPNRAMARIGDDLIGIVSTWTC